MDKYFYVKNFVIIQIVIVCILAVLLVIFIRVKNSKPSVMVISTPIQATSSIPTLSTTSTRKR